MALRQKNRGALGNFGYSMVELLVTIAIMAVLMGGSLVSYTLVTRTNVKKAASVTDDLLSTARVNAKAKATSTWAVKLDYTEATPTVAIYKGSSTSDSGEETSSEKLPKNVELTVVYYDEYENATTKKIGSGAGCDADTVRIYYSQLTGGIDMITCESGGIGNKVVLNGETDESGTVTLKKSGYCDLIFSNNRTYTVRIYLATGKQEILE